MLRDYQQKLFDQVRQEFASNRSVLMQLPTGAGKTHIFVEMVYHAQKKGRTTWIIVPRNELLRQASDKLSDRGVAHGLIAAGHAESRAFDTHVVSKDTLIRRYDKIKQPPDFAIIDEAHLALDRYKEIFEKFPAAKFLGVTATPERLDGRGLSEIYQKMVLGPSLEGLIEEQYLSQFRYFWRPLADLEKLHRRGTDCVETELEELFSKRKIYGKVINHYRQHADGKPCLVFCRSVKAAEKTAQQFCEAGYHFENIDGTMSYKARQKLIQGLKDGELHGLTSCELVTYGLDVPRVKCIIMLRPTFSRTLYFQMIGRGLRPWPGDDSCVVLDHVNNIAVHGHPLDPANWNFDGKDKKARKADVEKEQLKLCPQMQYLYCRKTTCVGCEHNTEDRGRRELEVVDTQLEEIDKPARMRFMPPESRLEIQARIGKAIRDYATGDPEIMCKAIAELLDIAKMTKRKPIWVYRILDYGPEYKGKLINVSILHEIARQRKYKHGWVYVQIKEMEHSNKKRRKS